MKFNKLLLCLTLALSLSVIQQTNVYAGTFIQNACWLVTDAGEEPKVDDDILILGVTDIGGGHFGFSGYVLGRDGENEDSPQLLNGNGEIIGDKVVVGLEGVLDDSEEIGTLSLYVRINLSDLSGNFTGIGTFYDKIDEVTVTDRGAGSLLLTECPV